MMLIDLDRSRVASDIANIESAYVGEMYIVPEASLTYKQLDWKQLGLLIARIKSSQTQVIAILYLNQCLMNSSLI